jgi:hypothetical protein
MSLMHLAMAELATLLLFGCTQTTHLVPDAAQVATAKPQTIYYKPGATYEEFQRTKERCTVKAEKAETDADPFSRWSLRTRAVVYGNCLRADGWVPVQH